MTSSQTLPANNAATTTSSPTAAQTPDTFGLGTTQGQRSAEMVAAFRAEVMPSPETKALASMKGRITAGVVMRLARSKLSMFNFIVARPAAFKVIIENNIPKDKADIKIVEIAAGLSPRGLYLARALPNAQIIEVDLPGVVKEKESRYRKAKIDIPSNLSWRGADLGVTPLAQVLEGQKVDIVTSEGLNQYFPPKEIQNIARYIYETLIPGGAYICDISIDEFRKVAEREIPGAANFFSRQAGKFSGIVENEDAAKDLLLGAGYERVEVYRPSAVAESLREVPKPVVDLSAIFCAHKKTE
jgi:O-methyltransferase involved in polyketide biosynthesis